MTYIKVKYLTTAQMQGGGIGTIYYVSHATCEVKISKDKLWKTKIV